jgi:kynureninase
MTAGTPLTAGEVEAWRAQFPILSRCTYLVNNSLGAMPVGVPEALAGFADAWSTKGVEAWTQDWLPLVKDVSDRLADLLGAPASSVTVHQNVATLFAMVVGALDPTESRHRVVMSDLEWPSHRYLAQQRPDLEPVIVPTDGLSVDTERLVAAIDERTLLVPLSHVLFRSASITDVAAVTARCRAVGAVSLVDGYHALGHLPVDVVDLGCDFYVGGSVKWLCGGPGVAYLYVAPDTALRLPARQVGWLGHADPFAFAEEWDPAPAAAGWLGGTPSVAALYAARVGHRIIAEVGPDRIRATTRPLTAALVEGARARGLAVATPLDPDRRAGTVTIAADETTARRLVAAGIIVDHRPRAGIRVGPHFFNTTAECERLLDALVS